MKLSDLNPCPDNPRKISDEALDRLKSSIDQFGDLGCLVYNIRDKTLRGGNQRLKALPPDSDIIITQTYDKPTRTGTVREGHVLIAGEKFKYREVDWDEATAIAAMIAANKQGGTFDFSKLPDLILKLDQVNFDLNLTGFDKVEIQNLMAPIKAIENINSDLEEKQYIISCHLENELEMQDLYDDLISKGIKCKIIT